MDPRDRLRVATSELCASCRCLNCSKPARTSDRNSSVNADVRFCASLTSAREAPSRTAQASSGSSSTRANKSSSFPKRHSKLEMLAPSSGANVAADEAELESETARPSSASPDLRSHSPFGASSAAVSKTWRIRAASASSQASIRNPSCRPTSSKARQREERSASSCRAVSSRKRSSNLCQARCCASSSSALCGRAASSTIWRTRDSSATASTMWDLSIMWDDCCSNWSMAVCNCRSRLTAVSSTICCTLFTCFSNSTCCAEVISSNFACTNCSWASILACTASRRSSTA
mmetsp:Transcript_95635/g.309793  ORF Transcript_95635/g.309793 Transcript_95635/m.309793 type:complete len:290 (+) Transcript_95635:454-1323(+)